MSATPLLRAVPAALLVSLGVALAQAPVGSDARLQLRTSGPTRVYLTDVAGAPLTPTRTMTYDKPDEHHFIVPGHIEIDLRPGRYRLAAERGPEHRPVFVDLELRAGERREIELHPERWIDMNAKGWYSGDLHNHRNLDARASSSTGSTARLFSMAPPPPFAASATAQPCSTSSPRPARSTSGWRNSPTGDSSFESPRAAS